MAGRAFAGLGAVLGGKAFTLHSGCVPKEQFLRIRGGILRGEAESVVFPSVEASDLACGSHARQAWHGQRRPLLALKLCGSLR